MLREKLLQHQTEKGFRWRSHEIARIEGLSDAVFAFAVTLLVVSLEVPKTFNELTVIMRGFVPFAISFALLMKIWHEQYIFFRRYNLQDTVTVALNLVLLFMVLFYVYPLKFLFGYLINSLIGGSTQVRLPGGGFENIIEPDQLPSLMAIYSAGYFAVCSVFLALFYRALRKRRELELSDMEIFETRLSIGAILIQGIVAAVSLIMALAGSERMAGRAGMIYPVLLSPGLTVYYSIMGRRKRKLETAVRVPV